MFFLCGLCERCGENDENNVVQVLIGRPLQLGVQAGAFAKEMSQVELVGYLPPRRRRAAADGDLHRVSGGVEREEGRLLQGEEGRGVGEATLIRSFARGWIGAYRVIGGFVR